MEDAQARFGGSDTAFRSLAILAMSRFPYGVESVGSRAMPFGPYHLENAVPPLLASVAGGRFIAGLQARVDEARHEVDAVESSLAGQAARPEAQRRPGLVREREEMLRGRQALAPGIETRIVGQEPDVLGGQVENDLPLAASRLTEILEWLQTLPGKRPRRSARAARHDAAMPPRGRARSRGGLRAGVAACNSAGRADFRAQ